MPGVTPRLTGHNARNAPGIIGYTMRPPVHECFCKSPMYLRQRPSHTSQASKDFCAYTTGRAVYSSTNHVYGCLNSVGNRRIYDPKTIGFWRVCSNFFSDRGTLGFLGGFDGYPGVIGGDRYSRVSESRAGSLPASVAVSSEAILTRDE